MKLIEIKNNFAKLYYRSTQTELYISDFLTIDDKRRKLIAQVISVDSTGKADVNCAVVKFSMLLLPDNVLKQYNGYVPSLNAEVTKTDEKIINSLFAPRENTFCIGDLAASSELPVYLKKTFADNFVYIQSDKVENTNEIFNVLISNIKTSEKKVLFVDTNNLYNIESAQNLVICKDFKLPINVETLNYIYENDLDGLTVEEKTIVQDIILEIQDYIESQENKFIPFSTLLSVVNDIYESDKSVGIILFRNKLLKYNQYNLFASDEDEFTALNNALIAGGKICVKLIDIPINWQKQTIKYLLQNINENIYFAGNIDESVYDKSIIDKLQSQRNIYPIVSSSYSSKAANMLKSFAQNMILFAPENVQKSYPTYSSFLSKLNNEEYVVSGKSTSFIPLILKPSDMSGVIETVLENEIVEIPQKTEEEVQEEISRDVDAILYAESKPESVQPEPVVTKQTETINSVGDSIAQEEIIDEELAYEDMFTDEDLDLLDESSDDNMLLEEPINDINLIDDESQELIIDSKVSQEPVSVQTQNYNIPLEQPVQEIKQEPVQELPIYTSTPTVDAEAAKSIKISEGNIVYHEKYGRGVVEQIISYGQKTLCSVQFDNIGRRLLDPKLADLKQV